MHTQKFKKSLNVIVDIVGTLSTLARFSSCVNSVVYILEVEVSDGHLIAISFALYCPGIQSGQNVYDNVIAIKRKCRTGRQGPIIHIMAWLSWILLRVARFTYPLTLMLLTSHVLATHGTHDARDIHAYGDVVETRGMHDVHVLDERPDVVHVLDDLIRSYDTHDVHVHEGELMTHDTHDVRVLDGGTTGVHGKRVEDEKLEK